MSKQSDIIYHRKMYRKKINPALGDYEDMILSFELTNDIDRDTFNERKAKNPILNKLGLIPLNPKSVTEHSKRYVREKRKIDIIYFELMRPEQNTDRPYMGWWKSQTEANGLIKILDYNRLTLTEKGYKLYETFRSLREELGL